MNQTQNRIIPCAVCGTRNRLPRERLAAGKCGKCGAPLVDPDDSAGRNETYVLRCGECGTRNKVPSTKIGQAAKCGKCGAAIRTDDLLRSEPVMVSDLHFPAQVLKSPLPVLLFCWATWCPTCGAVAPVVDQLAAQWKGKIRVAKLNVDPNPMLAAKFDLRSVPTFLVFDHGQLKDTLVGGMPKEELVRRMAPYL